MISADTVRVFLAEVEPHSPFTDLAPLGTSPANRSTLVTFSLLLATVETSRTRPYAFRGTRRLFPMRFIVILFADC